MEKVSALVFWYKEEKAYSIIQATAIIQPRKEPTEYAAGKNILAKWNGRASPAIIIETNGK